MGADALVREITAYHRLRWHDAVVDAIILAALESNLVACREVAKHFKCPFLTGHSRGRGAGGARGQWGWAGASSWSWHSRRTAGGLRRRRSG